MSEPRRSFFRDPQLVIAIGVTVISLCAFVVSVMQTRIMQEERELLREYSRASVWPRLELGLTKGHDPVTKKINHFVLNLTNSGVGPAIITDVTIKYEDKVSNHWWHLFELQNLPDSIDRSISNIGFNGRIIKIGETVEILKLNDNLPLAEVFFSKLEGVTIDIYYESIYGEKWKYEIGNKTEKTFKIEDFEGLPMESQFGG